MIVIFDSLTGQTKKFADNLGFKSVHVKLYEGSPDDEIFLVTRSINFGQIPLTTKDFLDTYKEKVIGVAVSGNRNWGINYGKAGESIESYYGIPLVLKFEGSGYKSDVLKVKEWISNNSLKKEV